MSLKPFQEKILKQLIHQEVLLSRLYTLFSRQFPQQKEFWGKLSKEEERHAKLIEKLLEATKTGLIFFNEGKTKTYTLNAFITRLEGIIEKAESGEFDLSSAFAYAVDYESSLIEKNVFSYFDSLSDKAKGTLKILQSETVKHVERIRHAQKASLSK
ncbi:ferritin family protein [Thermodesulfobacteriota bacterium]